MPRWTLWLLSASLLGCGASVAGNTSDAAVATPPPRTLDFAFTSLTIDESTSATRPHTGFNLDGRYSSTPLQATDCGHGDFFSALDPDQNENGCPGGTTGCRGGVDNQLPALADATDRLLDLRSELALSVANGTLAVLMRIEGVNDLTNDPEVTVSLNVGHPMFAACERIGTPQQHYALDTSSLLTDEASRYRFAAQIRGSRLRLRSSSDASENLFVLLTPRFRELRRLNLHAFNLRVTLTEDRGMEGNMGGYALGGEVSDGLGSGFGATSYPYIVEGIVSSLVDIALADSCEARTDALSIGMGFALTRAVIQPTPVSGPVPGMCGSAP